MSFEGIEPSISCQRADQKLTSPDQDKSTDRDPLCEQGQLMGKSRSARELFYLNNRLLLTNHPEEVRRDFLAVLQQRTDQRGKR